MEKIGIITDEGADLTKEITQKYKIPLVPFKIDWPDIEMLSGNNIFQKMRKIEEKKIKTFGKTSQPSPKDFLDRYKEQLKKFENIICITLTSKLSGTYNSAIQAKNFLKPEDQKRIFVIDSLNGTAGQSLLVLKAIELIEKKKTTLSNMIEELNNLIPEIKVIGMLNDPKWLESSGRIPHLLADWLRQMAKIGIRPLLGVKDGVIKAIGVKKGVKDFSAALFKEFEARTSYLRKLDKKIKIVITHGDYLIEALKLERMLKEKFINIEIVFINLIDKVIGSIFGPNTLICGWCES